MTHLKKEIAEERKKSRQLLREALSWLQSTGGTGYASIVYAKQAVEHINRMNTLVERELKEMDGAFHR